MQTPEFQMVRSDDGWHVRFVAANGLTLARSSETYTRKRAARRLVELLAGVFGLRVVQWGAAADGADPGHYVMLVDQMGESRQVFVRFLDERTGDKS